MKPTMTSKDEEKIFSIIGSHRKKAFSNAEEQMNEAFDKIGCLLAQNSMINMHRHKINGISPETFRELYQLYTDGKTCMEAGEDVRKRWFVEFIKAQSLSFEVQKARYPNFLKPWTGEDDDKLELLWCEGVGEKEISRILMRHPNAITARISKLELIAKYGER